MPGGKRIGGKSLLLSEDAASSCGVASWGHLFDYVCSPLGVGVPSASRVVSCGAKVAKGTRSSSRVNFWNLAVDLSFTTSIDGHSHSAMAPVWRQLHVAGEGSKGT